MLYLLVHFLENRNIIYKILVEASLKMKFEKLSENKLRIILSIKDLEEKDINFHDFMSNSLETQDLFLDMLEEAEEQVGFNTRNYRVKIEALAMTDMDFIVTITRMIPESEKAHSISSAPRKKLFSQVEELGWERPKSQTLWA